MSSPTISNRNNLSFSPVITPTPLKPTIKTLTAISAPFFNHDPRLLHIIRVNINSCISLTRFFFEKEKVLKFCQKVKLRCAMKVDLKKTIDRHLRDIQINKQPYKPKFPLPPPLPIDYIQLTICNLITQLSSSHLKSYNIKENSIEFSLDKPRKIEISKDISLKIPIKVIFRISNNMLIFNENFCPSFNELKWWTVTTVTKANKTIYKIQAGSQPSIYFLPLNALRY